MAIEVACGRCQRSFPADTHAGLVRCGDCEDLAVPRIDGVGVLTVELDDGDWQ